MRRYALPGGQRDMELRPPLPPVPLEVAPEPAPNPLLTSGQLLVEDARLAILQIIPLGACILSSEAQKCMHGIACMHAWPFPCKAGREQGVACVPPAPLMHMVLPLVTHGPSSPPMLSHVLPEHWLAIDVDQARLGGALAAAQGHLALVGTGGEE